MVVSRLRRALLPASLILNLFLLAMIGGHLLRAELAPGPSFLAHALQQAGRALGPRDAIVFRDTLRVEQPRFATAAAALAQSREKLADQILAPQLDPAATRAALLAWRADWLRFTDAFSGPLVDALAKVSPDGRRRLVAERRRDAPPLKAP